MVVAGRRAPQRTPAPPISPLGRLAGVPALLVVGRASVGVVGVVLLVVVVAAAVAGRLVPYLTVVVPVVGSSPPGPSRGSIVLSLSSSPDPTPPPLPSGLGGSKGVRSGGGSCSALLRGGRLPELGRGGNPSPPTAPPPPPLPCIAAAATAAPKLSVDPMALNVPAGTSQLRLLLGPWWNDAGSIMCSAWYSCDAACVKDVHDDLILPSPSSPPSSFGCAAPPSCPLSSSVMDSSEYDLVERSPWGGGGGGGGRGRRRQRRRRPRPLGRPAPRTAWTSCRRRRRRSRGTGRPSPRRVMLMCLGVSSSTSIAGGDDLGLLSGVVSTTT